MLEDEEGDQLKATECDAATVMLALADLVLSA
jgi:hypothetical protein